MTIHNTTNRYDSRAYYFPSVSFPFVLSFAIGEWNILVFDHVLSTNTHAFHTITKLLLLLWIPYINYYVFVHKLVYVDFLVYIFDYTYMLRVTWANGKRYYAAVQHKQFNQKSFTAWTESTILYSNCICQIMSYTNTHQHVSCFIGCVMARVPRSCKMLSALPGAQMCTLWDYFLQWEMTAAECLNCIQI